MRKLIFTNKSSSHSWGGSFEVDYRDQVIQEVNFKDCTLNEAQRQFILKHLPVILDIEAIKAFLSKTMVEVVESTVVPTFTDFWEAYKKKINKKRCEPLWAKLSDSNKSKAVEGIAIYDKHLAKTGRFKADPENYIRNEMWLNEWG